MRKKRNVLLVGIMTLFCLNASLLGLELSKCSIPPVIDGKLDDQIWKQTNKISDFKEIGNKKNKSPYTTAYLTHDNQWLYVAFDIKQSENERLAPVFIDGHDDFVQRDDCVKLSFFPGEGDKWYHFKLNRANIRQDRRIVGNRHEVHEWNIPWRSAVENKVDSWTVEMAIPLKLLPPVESWDKAKFNLINTRKHFERDPYGVIISQPKLIHYSLAPLEKSWVEYQRFLPLNGLNIKDSKDAFAPWISNVKLGEYQQANGKLFYTVIFDIKGFTPKVGDVNLKVGNFLQPYKVNSKNQNVILNIPVKSFSTVKPVLQLLSNDKKEILQKISFPKTEIDKLNIFDAYVARNYYTREKDADIIFDLRLPESVRKTMKVALFDEANKKMTDFISAQNNRIKVEVEKLKLTDNNISIRVFDNKDNLCAEQKLCIVRRKPNVGGSEWKIDHENQRVLKNGKPHFVFGMVGTSSLKIDPQYLKRLSSEGMNLYMIWKSLTPKEASKYINMLADANLDVMLAVDDAVKAQQQMVDVVKKYDPKNVEFMKKRVKTSSLTGLLGFVGYLYQQKNMPMAKKNEIHMAFFEAIKPLMKPLLEIARKSPNYGISFVMDEPQEMVDEYLVGEKMRPFINSIDGYHPVLVNYSSYFPKNKRWTSFMDILCADPYWVPEWSNLLRNNVNFISHITRLTESRAKENRIPFYSMPMGYYWSRTAKRGPSVEEQRCQTYLAAIHGSQGVIYFYEAGIPNKKMWDELYKLGNEFRDVLGEACALPLPKQTITYKKKGKNEIFDPINNRFVTVQTSLKKAPNGGYILLTANSAHYKVRSNFTLKGLKATKITRYFGNEEYKVRNGRFSDTIEPFGVRAYKISEIDLPANITVDSVAAEKIFPQKTVEYSWNYGFNKKNLAYNSSFEETIDDVPVFYYMQHHHHIPEFVYLQNNNEVTWGVDTTEAKFGKQSLKMTWPVGVYTTTAISFPNNDNVFYTLSLYIKGNRDKIKVAVVTPIGTKWLEVNKEWKRYTITGKPPKSLGFKNSKYKIILKEKSPSTIYIDGIQLEKGDKATEYTDN